MGRRSRRMLPKGAACAGRWACPPRANSPSTRQMGPPSWVSGNLNCSRLILISSRTPYRTAPLPRQHPCKGACWGLSCCSLVSVEVTAEFVNACLQRDLGSRICPSVTEIVRRCQRSWAAVARVEVCDCEWRIHCTVPRCVAESCWTQVNRNATFTGGFKVAPQFVLELLCCYGLPHFWVSLEFPLLHILVPSTR